MTLNDYQEQAAETAQYPGQEHGQIWYLALGLANQAGKLAKGAQRLVLGRPVDRDALKKALGAGLWYLAAMANALGLPLEQVARANLDDLATKEFTPYE